MQPLVRRVFQSTPGLRQFYYHARLWYNSRRTLRAGRSVFRDQGRFRRALTQQRAAQRMNLEMQDGLHFTVRQNRRDATVLAEVFVDREYTHDFYLSSDPVVVDVGGLYRGLCDLCRSVSKRRQGDQRRGFSAEFPIA